VLLRWMPSRLSPLVVAAVSAAAAAADDGGGGGDDDDGYTQLNGGPARRAVKKSFAAVARATRSARVLQCKPAQASGCGVVVGDL